MVQLSDGKPDALPTHYAGAIRIRALPPQTVVHGQTRKEGETLFALGLCLEAKIPLEKVVGVHVEKATDENGQSLAQITEPAPDPGANQPTFIGNVNGRAAGMIGTGDIQAPVKLKAGEKASKQLKELTGVLTAQVRTPPEVTMTVDNILKATSKSIEAKDGTKLTVLEVEHDEKGEVRVRVEISPLLEPVRINGRGQVRAMVMVGANGMVLDFSNDAPTFKLVDAKGAEFPQPSVPSRGFKVANNVVSHELTLVFQPQQGQAEASKLQYLSSRRVVVEIPFRLKDVPLP
jgi:hypothetical protein